MSSAQHLYKVVYQCTRIRHMFVCDSHFWIDMVIGRRLLRAASKILLTLGLTLRVQLLNQKNKNLKRKRENTA